MTRPHKFRHHRREIRHLKRRLAATEAALRICDEALQLQPTAESFLKVQVGLFVGALARVMAPKPAPQPLPSTVVVTSAFGICQRKKDE